MLLASRYGTVASISGDAFPKIVVADGSVYYYSTDGTTWTTASMTAMTAPNGGAMDSTGQYVLFANEAAQKVRFSSDYAASFSNQTVYNYDPGITNAFYAESVNTWAVVATESAFYLYPKVWYSTNYGSTWNVDSPNQFSSGGYGYACKYINGQWIYVSRQGSTTYAIQTKTTLGSGSWTGKTTSFSNADDIDYDGTNYVAAVQSSSVYTSPNLTTWTARSVGATMNRVVHGNGVWLAMGSPGSTTNIVYRSTDNGVTWSAGPSVNRMYAWAWSPSLGKFFGVGDAGKVMSSADGTSWSTQSLGTGNYLGGIAVR